jgi:hypothetical protein
VTIVNFTRPSPLTPIPERNAYIDSAHTLLTSYLHSSCVIAHLLLGGEHSSEEVLKDSDDGWMDGVVGMGPRYSGDIVDAGGSIWIGVACSPPLPVPWLLMLTLLTTVGSWHSL